MVRNYKPKKDSLLLKSKIDAAILRVEVDNLSVRSAAKEVGLTLSTLQRHMESRKKADAKKSVGAPLSIPEVHENELATCLKSMAKWGFPLTRKEIKVVVSEFITENKDDTSELSTYLKKYCKFKDNIPGEDWLSSFMVRHNLSSKKPCTLEKARVVATSNPFLIYEFYDLLENELNELELTTKPSHIYNLDETAMCMDPSRGKAIGEKGKSLARLTATSGRETVTVMACVNAAGERRPPLIIFSGKKLQSTWRSSTVDENMAISISENGWMTTNIFESWFSLFCQQVKKRPLLIIYDGHKSHVSLKLIEKAIKENISILKLPAHTTDALQPLDKCCFKPLKTQWDKTLVETQRLSSGAKVSKACFTELVDKIWPVSLTKSNIIAGFKATGIFPVDRSKYPVERLCSRMLTSYDAQNSPRKRDRPSRSIVASNNSDSIASSTSNNSDAIAASNDLQSNSNQQNNNMQILDSVKDGAPIVTSPTFEGILSRRLRQTPSVKTSETRRKIDTNSAVITSKDFLHLVTLREQEIEKKAALKAQRMAAKAKKKCVTKNKNLEEIDEPSAKRALLSTSNEDLKVPSGSGDIEQLKKHTTLEQAKILLAYIHDTIKEQIYFAVYYDNDPFYIGKVTKVIDEENVEMKFLEKGAGNFRWPKRDKLEIINIKYIFYGPVILIGSNPFDVDNAAITMAYKCYKRLCQELWL